MNTHKQTPEVRGGESVEELRARVGGLERVLGSSTGKGAAELREKLGIKATGRAAKREAERRSTKPKAGVRSRWVYGPDTDRSFFRDLVRVQLHDRRMNELISQGYRPSGLGIEQGIPIMGDGTVADALVRDMAWYDAYLATCRPPAAAPGSPGTDTSAPRWTPPPAPRASSATS